MSIELISESSVKLRTRTWPLSFCQYVWKAASGNEISFAMNKFPEKGNQIIFLYFLWVLRAPNSIMLHWLSWLVLPVSNVDVVDPVVVVAVVSDLAVVAVVIVVRCRCYFVVVDLLLLPFYNVDAAVVMLCSLLK